MNIRISELRTVLLQAASNIPICSSPDRPIMSLKTSFWHLIQRSHASVWWKWKWRKLKSSVSQHQVNLLIVISLNVMGQCVMRSGVTELSSHIHVTWELSLWSVQDRPSWLLPCKYKWRIRTCEWAFKPMTVIYLSLIQTKLYQVSHKSQDVAGFLECQPLINLITRIKFSWWIVHCCQWYIMGMCVVFYICV